VSVGPSSGSEALPNVVDMGSDSGTAAAVGVVEDTVGVSAADSGVRMLAMPAVLDIAAMALFEAEPSPVVISGPVAVSAPSGASVP
jgi:hypothetical protein